MRVWMLRPLPDGRAVVANLDPGIPVGMAITEFPEQTFDHIWINHHVDGDWSPPKDRPNFGTLDAVTASELIRDLTEATAK